MPARDDKLLTVSRRDISGGINTRQFGTDVKENQVTSCINIDLETPGKWKRRKGNALVEDLGNDVGFAAAGFNPDGGTDVLVVAHGTKVETYPGSSTFTERKIDFTSATSGTILQSIEEGEGDILLVKFSGNNWFRLNSSYTAQDLGSTSGTGTDSPPDSDIAAWFRGRLWIMSGSQLFFSSSTPSDYSGAFDTPTDWYRVPVGTPKALVALRDQGLVIVGSEEIYGLNPSNTPVATDKVEKLLDIGTVAKNSVVQVGDDVFFLATDGVRALFRNIQDKLQLGVSYPVSYPLQDEIGDINWAYADKAQAVFFENKYLLAVPTGSSTTNNKVYCYYPATGGWSVFTNWNVGAWGNVKFSNEEKLYYIDSTDASVYQAFNSNTDNGSAIPYTLISRREDLGTDFQDKNGGEFRCSGLASANIDVDVAIEFDENGFNTLGQINLLGNALAYPLTFPVNFQDSTKVRKSFQLDGYEGWERARVRFQNTDDVSDSALELTSYDIVTLLDEYVEEDLNG